jgi:hypothetical protein
VPAHRPREHYLLQVAAFLHQVVERVAMRYSNCVLLDDGSFVEHLGHIMAGGAHQFDSPLIRTVIGLGPYERRQEGMVNIDDPVGVGGDEVAGENLHVTRQHHHLNLVIAQQLKLGLFREAFVPPATGT